MVLVHNFPEAAGIGMGWHALEQHTAELAGCTAEAAGQAGDWTEIQQGYLVAALSMGPYVM